jgi:regulator of protease activity HflC (stomatin/prohibitin superfamily)
MTISSKRAENVAIVSLVVDVVFFVVVLLIGRWSGFVAVNATAWLILSAVLVWAVLALQFHQRSLAEQEKLDLSQLGEAEEGQSGIFQAKGEHAGLFAVAQRRLQILEKWFLPIFSAGIACYQIVVGLYLLKVAYGGVETEWRQPLLCSIFLTAVAFVSFLISRYATGMSEQIEWKPLRAGGSLLLAAALVCFSLAITLALAQFKIFLPLSIIRWAIPILLVVLGIETALNVVLDIYRPRFKDQYSRAAFDSRLLGAINEPGGIFRTAATAIDYQFGFKVSQTWFYKLLEKAIVPLVLFAGVTVYLLSCVVVVAPNEEAIIEHFGNPRDQAGQVRLIGPGLTFKWPWPIDIARRYPTKKIMELNIGFVPKVDPKTGERIREPLLWGKSHYEVEYNVLVASTHTAGKETQGAVPISFVKANIPVQYKVKDLYAFLYNHQDSARLLESICYRQLANFAAGATIDVDSEADIQRSLLGAGRAEAKRLLTERIQASADETGLGVEITFLGLQGIHPPPEVAPDYQKVIGAIQKRQATVLAAQAQRNKTLSNLAGSVDEADRLYELAAQYQRAQDENNTVNIEKLGGEIDLAFSQAKGEIFETLRQAQGYEFEKAILAKATSEHFQSQVQAYQAAPEIYKHQLAMGVYEEIPKNIRKYIIAADLNDTQVTIIDLQEKLTPSLYELGGFEETRPK